MDRKTAIIYKIISVTFVLVLIFASVARFLFDKNLKDRENSVAAMDTNQLLVVIEQPMSDLFYFAISELANRKDIPNTSAPTLVQALNYPRRDAIEAGEVLINMGENAETAIPSLIETLKNEHAEIRAYATAALGAIGTSAKCAVPAIAGLLWDDDPMVRATAANALDAIMGIDLVDDWPQIDFSNFHGLILDSEDRSLTEKARTWWSNEGRINDWSLESDKCVVK